MSVTHNKKELLERRKYLRKEQTKAEEKLWYMIRANRLNGIKFKRQHSIDWFILDFYCPSAKVAIEIDGDSHFTDQGKEYDRLRTILLNGYDIEVIRFTNDEIVHDLENVLRKIVLICSTSPNLPLQRGGK